MSRALKRLETGLGGGKRRLGGVMCLPGGAATITIRFRGLAGSIKPGLSGSQLIARLTEFDGQPLRLGNLLVDECGNRSPAARQIGRLPRIPRLRGVERSEVTAQ